ncbi:MAG TPA: hypothetical protein VK437_12525 [Steroidobacteraceae bacterium]|nr:hypothetical protein [Steroidobacteraceae bacterium]
MTDREVARLRRLRAEALDVREIARTLGESRWARNEPLLERGACAGWRIARIVSGHLRAHPYVRYQRDAGFADRIRGRLLAQYLALVTKNRDGGLKEYEARLRSLARQLDDARALTWSADLSDRFGRSQGEIRSLLETVAQETHSVSAPERLPKKRPERTEGLVGELAKTFEGDWPYLAF